MTYLETSYTGINLIKKKKNRQKNLSNLKINSRV